METLIVHPDNKEQLAALKAFMKAFKISFEEEKSTYDPDLLLRYKRAGSRLKEAKPGL